MARRRVTVEGLGQLRRRLDQLDEQIRAGVNKAVRESAKAVREDAAGRVRVDTGRLRDELLAVVNERRLSAEVGWFDDDLYYARYHEFGTSSIPANPVLATAAERERRRFVRRLTEDVRGEIGQ